MKEQLKQKVLNEINNFINTLNMFMKIGPAKFAEEYFYKVVNNFWDDSKTEEENLKTIKDMFEMSKKMNEISGNIEAVKTISVFQEGWLNKL